MSQCPVVADFDFNRACNNGTIHFDDNSYLVNTGLIVDWHWNFGDGTSSTEQNPIHDFVPGVTYNVQLTVTDSSGCTDFVILPVYVEPLPVASFTFSPNNVCSGSTISFSNTSTGNGLTYSWNFGDGVSSTQQNPSHIFTSYGCGTQTFNVTLTVTDANGCVSSITQQVSILRQPEVLFIENNGFVFCHTDTTNIKDTATVFNFSPDAACIASYTVDWGDGSPIETIALPFDGTNPVKHVYTSLGYHTVVFTATGINGCVTTNTQTVRIESNPVAVLVGPPTGTNIGCAPMHICVTNISQNVSPTTTLTLNWGDGFSQSLPPSSVGNSICHTYTTGGCSNGVMTNYTITLTASNTCDFSSVTWSPVRIYEPPQASFYPQENAICLNEPAVFINNTEPNSCATSSYTTYTWDFGDGTTYGPTPVHWSASPQQIISHTFPATGTYTVTLTAENNSSNGCGSTQYSTTIFVSETYAEFSHDTVCYGTPTHFTDQSWANGANVTSWYWSFGDGYTSTQQNPSHTYNSPGNYNVCLTVNTNLNCSNTICHTIHVNPLPTPIFTATTACIGEATQFTNNSHGNGGATIVSSHWNFGDGSSSNETNPSHIYANSGNFTVTLTVVDSEGCTRSIQHTVSVSPLPIANFTANTACLGSSTNFHSTSSTSMGSITQWEWDFGDGVGTATGVNTNYTYADTGVYNVTLIVVTNIGCRDTIVSPIYVSPNPDANFSADIVCAGNETSFTDLSVNNGVNIVSWHWNFGDGGSSTLQNPTHTYTQGGTYNVTLTVTNANNCIDAITLPVVVDSIPFADFTYEPACLGFTTVFNDVSIPHGSQIISWEWDFGDGYSSTDQNPTHTYANFGTYNVFLQVTNANGCTDTITLPVVVYEPPTADFGWNGSCLGLPTVFTDSSHSNTVSITDWNWDFGDGSGTSILQNPSYTYASSGLFNVTLIVFDSNGCSDTITQSVYVSDLPTADFSNTSACAQDSLFFTDLSNGNGSNITSWHWDFDDGNYSTDQSPAHLFATSGSFNVQLIVTTDYGCHDTIVQTIAVDSLPTANFSHTTVCFGDTTYFTDISLANGGTISNWYWDFGDGNTDNQQNPSHLYSSDGTFNVTLFVENTAGCTDSINIPVVVRPLPIPDFSWQTACVNQEIHFNDLSSGNSTINAWEWDFGDGVGVLHTQNPTYTYNSTGTYNVSLTVTDVEGCSNYTDTLLSVETVPTAQFATDSVCFGNLTPFTDLSNGNGSAITSWNWSFGDGNSSTQQNTQNHYNASGSYNVQLIVSNAANCADTITEPVFVKPSPQANYSFSNVCDGHNMNFQDLSISNSINISSWAWNFGDGSTSSLQDVSHTYGAPGIYGVELIVENDYSCFDTITQNVEVYQLPNAEFMASVACLGFATSFQDLSTFQGAAITSWEWNFGDGTGTSTQQNPDWTYSAGTPPYDVSLTVRDANGCMDSVHHLIDLHPQPTVDFSATTACSRTATEFTDQSQAVTGGTMQTWNWNFGDGGTSTQQNPNHTYSPVSTITTFDVTLIATDNNGCPDTMTHVVTVNPQPIADFTSDTVCSGGTTTFQDLSSAIPGLTIDTWSWDFGDTAGSSNIPDPTYTYGPVSTITNFNTVLIITDSNGCSDTINKNTVVNPLPIPYFSATTACSGNNTEFNDLSQSNGGNISSWDWDFGDNSGHSTLQNPQYNYSTVMNPTTFNVNLIVEDINGCVNDTIITVLVNPLPIADFSSEPTCSGFPTSFIDSSYSAGGNINTWTWNFGDGVGSSSEQNPNYDYPQTPTIDTYDVSLIVTDVNGCIDTVVYQATVIPSPISNFVSDSVCSGITAQFNDFSSTLGGTIISWNWDFGDGIGTSDQPNPDYLYNNVNVTTSYQVQLTVENSFGCIDSIEQTAIVYPLPIPNFSTDTACVGDITNFFDASNSLGGNITNWQWNFGDGIGSSTQQNPQYVYGNHGIYSVDLTVTDENTCQNSIQHTIVVDSLPMPSFTWTATCQHGIINFTNTSDGNGSNITSYFWNFDDGSMTILQNPIHYYSSYGNYDVSLTVNNDRGCSNVIVIPVSVEPGLEVDFTADNVCLGEEMYFYYSLIHPNMSAQTWLWSFGDGTYSTEPNPTHLYTQPGTYNVLLTCTDSLGCDFTVTKQVTVYVNPIADFSSTTVLINNPTSFTDNSYTVNGFITSWQWDFGDGGTSTQQNPLHTYANAGTYMTTLIVFNSFGCSDTITLPVIVDENVNADFVADTVCAGSPTSFTDLSYIGNGSIASWYWTFGDGGSSIQQNPQHVYVSDGVYVVKLTVTADNGIIDTISKQVLVLESPMADFTYTEVCFGNPTGLFDHSSGVKYPVSAWQWNLGDGNTSLQSTVQHHYNTSGQWQVQLIATNTIGCTDTIVKAVNVWEIPQVNFDAVPREGCSPLNVHFNDMTTISDGVINSWLWNFGDGYTSVSAGEAINNYNHPGTFNVSLTLVSNHGCVGSLTIPNMIQVFPLPIASFFYTPSNPTISDGIVFMDMSLGANQWFWDFGDNNFSDEQYPMHYYLSPGSYHITQIVHNEYGCADTTSSRIRINTNEIIWAPNAISVNNDGMNDVFNVYGIGWSSDNFELRIFNRWGEEIYYTTDINKGWDGTDENSGKKVHMGVYVWKVKIMANSNETFEYVGTVTVVQ